MKCTGERVVRFPVCLQVIRPFPVISNVRRRAYTSMVVSPNSILNPTIHRPIAGFVPASPPVTSNSIQNVLDSNSVVLIHFWAAWNGTDPPMDNQLTVATRKVSFAVHLASCNVDDPQCVDLCKRCGVVNIPYVGVFVDGELRPGIMGLREADQIVTSVTESVLNPKSPRPWWRFW